MDMSTKVHRLPLPPEEAWTGTRRLNPSWRLLRLEVNLPPGVHPFLPTQPWPYSHLTAVIQSAGVIQASAMESTERVVIRNAAATVKLAYVLGLRESSVMSLLTRAQNITHTETNEGVSEGI
jgi:hypothetical protein